MSVPRYILKARLAQHFRGLRPEIEHENLGAAAETVYAMLRDEPEAVINLPDGKIMSAREAVTHFSLTQIVLDLSA